jgi:hypothetical protein
LTDKRERIGRETWKRIIVIVREGFTKKSGDAEGVGTTVVVWLRIGDLWLLCGGRICWNRGIVLRRCIADRSGRNG